MTESRGRPIVVAITGASGAPYAVRLLEAPRWDLPLLDELARAMADASICGLGQAAPNPFTSVVRHFPQELA